ncbi:hypothetical protein ABT278_32295 [Streptomyces sp. NPDC001228]|uniref:hypothetical protein n=1 Tax=Streptomyces sp. NPDC001228 TaxID=3154381 RepID=UPI003333BE4D
MAGNGLGDFAAVAMARRSGPPERVPTVVLVGDEGRAVPAPAGGPEGVVRVTPEVLAGLSQDLDWVRAAYAAGVRLVLVDRELPTAAVLDTLAALRRELDGPAVEVVSVGGPFPCGCGAERLLPPGPAGDAVQALFGPLEHATVCLVGPGATAGHWAFVSALTSAEGTTVAAETAREYATCAVHDCSDALALVCAGALGFEGGVATFPGGLITRVDRSTASVVRFAAADEPLALVPHACGAAPEPGPPAPDETAGRPDAVTWRRLAQDMGLTGPRMVERALARLRESGTEPDVFPVHRLWTAG